MVRRNTLWAAQSGRSRWVTRASTSAGLGTVGVPCALGGVVGLTDHVGVVRGAAAAQPGVELVGVHGLGDQHVGLIDAETLRGGDRARIAEAHVGGHVLARQDDAAVMAGVLDGERADTRVDGDDVPAVVVTHPGLRPVAQAPMVAAGLDEVADPDRLGAGLRRHAQAGAGDLAGGDARPRGPGSPAGGAALIRGEHDRVLAGLLRGPPALEARPSGLRLTAAMEAPVGPERLEPGAVASAQLRQRAGFPGMGEPMRLAQLGRSEGLGQGGEHAARRGHRAELTVVADQHQLGAAAGDQLDEAIELAGVDHAGLIHDHHLAGRDVAIEAAWCAGRASQRTWPASRWPRRLRFAAPRPPPRCA